jgi:hypothetical protein
MDLPSCAIEHEEDPTAELVKAAAASPKPSVLLMMNPHYACSHWSDWTSHAVLAALRAARRYATMGYGRCRVSRACNRVPSVLEVPGSPRESATTVPES